MVIYISAILRVCGIATHAYNSLNEAKKNLKRQKMRPSPIELYPYIYIRGKVWKMFSIT